MNARGSPVITRQQPEALSQQRPQPAGPRGIAGWVHQPDETGVFSETCDNDVGETGRRARWHVVKNDRNSDRVSNGPKMGEQALLDGHVVLRNHRKNCVGAAASGICSELGGAIRRIRTRGGDHRHVPPRNPAPARTTSRRSSRVRIGSSPVVLHAISAVVSTWIC